MIVGCYVSQRGSLPLPTREMVVIGTSFVLNKNPIAFMAYLPGGGRVSIGGQVFSASLIAVQGAAAPIEITGEFIAVLETP